MARFEVGSTVDDVWSAEALSPDLPPTSESNKYFLIDWDPQVSGYFYLLFE